MNICLFIEIYIFNANLIKYMHLHNSVVHHIFTIYCYYLIELYCSLQYLKNYNKVRMLLPKKLIGRPFIQTLVQN